MKAGAIFVRGAYWMGAVLDAVMLVPMLLPPVGAAMFGISEFHPGPEYLYAMYVGAALMAGWTGLLLWASHKPVERSGVLLLTVVPVVLGLIAANGYAVSGGLVTRSHAAPVVGLQVFLGAFFLAAFALARRHPAQVA
jgi:4-amino-4-deoxy-L-arabinose transferase-like glycosyltransferase